MNHYSYPSINQFRTLLSEVDLRARYIGKDDAGEPIYTDEKKDVVLNLYGSVKLHGSNFSIVYTKLGEYYSQSRERVLDDSFDIHGFNEYSKKIKSYMLERFKDIYTRYESDDIEAIVVYGEYCGKGIQKKLALAHVDKFWAPFSINIKYKDVNKESLQLIPEELYAFDNDELRIHNVCKFGEWSIMADFLNPSSYDYQLEQITKKVEALCPAAKYFGVEGNGEGVVWTTHFNGKNFRMKIKGLSHSISKMKSIVEIDPTKVNSINEFIDYAVTDTRLNQGLSWVIDNKFVMDLSSYGKFIKWINEDILKEESDVLSANNLTMKDVSKAISNKAKVFYMNNI